jgi:hypothetical protein
MLLIVPSQQFGEVIQQGPWYEQPVFFHRQIERGTQQVGGLSGAAVRTRQDAGGPDATVHEHRGLPGNAPPPVGGQRPIPIRQAGAARLGGAVTNEVETHETRTVNEQPVNK